MAKRVSAGVMRLAIRTREAVVLSQRLPEGVTSGVRTDTRTASSAAVPSVSATPQSRLADALCPWVTRPVFQLPISPPQAVPPVLPPAVTVPLLYR